MAASASAASASSFPSPAPLPSSALLTFLSRYYLPLALVAAVCLGLACPGPGAAAADAGAAAVSASGIFLLQGLCLRRTEVAAALGARGALAWGALSILVVTPVAGAVVALPLVAKAAAALGWTAAGAGAGAGGVAVGCAAATTAASAATSASSAAAAAGVSPLASALLGLAAFACVPTALSSGATLTAQVRGNVALAVLLTVGSNLLGVATVPLLLPRALEAVGAAAATATAAASASASPAALSAGAAAAAAAAAASSAAAMAIDAAPLLSLLAKVVLLPVVAGAALRAWVPGVAAAVDARRRGVRFASAFLLALVPWSQVSRGALASSSAAAAAASASAAVSPPSSALPAGAALAVAAVVGLALHLLYLAINVAACRALRLGGELPEEEEKDAGRGAAGGAGAAAAGGARAGRGDGGEHGDHQGRAQEQARRRRRRNVLGVRRAVVLTCSVKTLPVAVAVLAQAAASGGGGPGALGPEAVVACVAAHLTQIVVDSALAARWADEDLAAADEATEKRD